MRGEYASPASSIVKYITWKRLCYPCRSFRGTRIPFHPMFHLQFRLSLGSLPPLFQSLVHDENGNGRVRVHRGPWFRLSLLVGIGVEVDAESQTTVSLPSKHPSSRIFIFFLRKGLHLHTVQSAFGMVKGTVHAGLLYTCGMSNPLAYEGLSWACSALSWIKSNIGFLGSYPRQFCCTHTKGTWCILLSEAK